MRSFLPPAFALGLLALPAQAQEIVEVPVSQSGVVLPQDIFSLPPGQWYVARLISQGSEPCTPDNCEAGFNSGDLAVSVEHSGNFVRAIAGFRGCPGVAYAEVETGSKPGSYDRGRVTRLIKDVVKGAGKSCKVSPPEVPKLDVKALFPAKGTG